jgi:hypothetical protein
MRGMADSCPRVRKSVQDNADTCPEKRMRAAQWLAWEKA